MPVLTWQIMQTVWHEIHTERLQGVRRQRLISKSRIPARRMENPLTVVPATS